MLANDLTAIFDMWLFTGPESVKETFTLENFSLISPRSVKLQYLFSLIKPTDTPRSKTAACIFDVEAVKMPCLQLLDHTFPLHCLRSLNSSYFNYPRSLIQESSNLPAPLRSVRNVQSWHLMQHFQGSSREKCSCCLTSDEMHADWKGSTLPD